MTRSNVDDAFNISRKILLFTGIWPVETPNMKYKLKSLLTWFCALSFYSVLLMPFFYYINDVAKLAETLYIMITYMAFIIKLAVFTFKRNDLLYIITFLKAPIFRSYSDDLDQYMAKAIKKFSLFSKVCLWCVLPVMLLYAISPFIDHKPLPFPIPYDLEKFTPIMYACQMIFETYSSFTHIGLDLTFLGLIGFASTQMSILSQKIIRFEEDIPSLDYIHCKTRDHKIIKNLKQCIQHHMAIIRVVNETEAIFTGAVFGQLVSSAMVLCNLLFQFVLVPISVQFFLLTFFVMAIFTQLFIYCWFGDKIICKSLKIRDACYTSSWHTTNNEVRQFLFLIMERSKRPLQITALKVSNLSLITFLVILQWSYSYLTLLLNMYNKRSLE